MNSYDEWSRMRHPQSQFDYRYGTPYRFTNRQPKLAADKSLFTFKGHAVLQTLIRC